MSAPIPEDLRELYNSTAQWDGRLMVAFVRSQRNIGEDEFKWDGDPDCMVRRILIERIAALEAQVQTLREAPTEGECHRFRSAYGDSTLSVYWIDRALESFINERAAIAATEEK